MKICFGILFLACVCFLTGCHKTPLSFAEVKPSPTVTITNGVATIHVQGESLGNGKWLGMESHFDGQTLCISGYSSSREQELDDGLVIKLPSGTPPTAVLWINPDGSRVPIPSAP